MPRRQGLPELILFTLLVTVTKGADQQRQWYGKLPRISGRAQSSHVIEPASHSLKDTHKEVLDDSTFLRQMHNLASQHVTNGRSRALVSLLVDTAQHDYVKGATALAKSSMLYAPDYFNARVLLVLKGRIYSSAVLQQAQSAGWTLRWVDPIDPPHPSTFPRFRDQFVKLHLWNLVEYTQVVYMDLDVAFVAPLTGNFVSRLAYPTKCKLWAARDIRAGVWQDGFNMGVAGVIPNATEYTRLMDLLMKDQVEYDYVMSEQGFLNKVYTESNGEWCELDFELNANLAAYSQVRSFWESTTPEVVHYTMSKPWECSAEYREVCDLWEKQIHSDIYPVTVVSAYFSGPSKHSSAEYQEWGKKFLAHKMPLVLFTDTPESIVGLQDRDKSITRIIVVNESAFMMSHKMFDWNKQLSLDPEKDIHSTHLFKVWLEKTNFVMNAMKLDPFKSPQYVWVDFGCFRSTFWNNTWVALSERLPKLEQQMLLLKSPGSDVSSLKQIGGTVFGGSKVAWRLWSMAFYNIVKRKYRQGEFIGDDQIPMTALASQHPKLVCVIQPQSMDGSDPWFFLLWYLADKAPQQDCSSNI